MDMEAAMKRIPPHSAEAEQAVLGAMLMNKEAITVASEILSGDEVINKIQYVYNGSRYLLYYIQEAGDTVDFNIESNKIS